MKPTRTAFLILTLGIFFSPRCQAQLEKIFVDDHRVFRAERAHCRWITLYVTGDLEQDTASIRLEVFNTGKYDYHPLAWHMVDSFLYAVELQRADDLFVRASLIRYTIPLSGNLDSRRVSQSMRYCNYVQILDKHLFSVSERRRDTDKPVVYFDFAIDQAGIMTVAILEPDQQLLYIYSKPIARYEKEASDNVPVYRRVDTWDAVDTISTQMDAPFRLIKENGRYFITDGSGRLYEAKNKTLTEQKTPTGPAVLVFDRQSEAVNCIPAGTYRELAPFHVASIRKHAEKLTDR